VTFDELAALVGAVTLIVVGAIVRQLWLLTDRVARLEGRLNGRGAASHDEHGAT
jgi:hypothetical protein